MALGRSLDLIVIGRDPLAGQEGSYTASIVARLGDDLAIAELPSDSTVAELLAYRERIAASLTNTATVPQHELNDYAKRLGRVLLDGDIGALYAEAKRDGVRMNLLINDCMLQRIPWEYLCAAGEQPLPSRKRGIARVVPCRRPHLAQSPPARPEGAVLRVLLAVSREAGDSVVPLEEMTAALRRKFELRMPKTGVHLEVRSVKTSAEFADAMDEPKEAWDIVQYLGHGEVRESRSSSTGGLRLAGDGTAVAFLSAQRLAALLSQRPPRLVLLTACNSAEVRVAAPFANIAQTLVMQGIPAVVANQMAIPADTVAEFCGGLFDQLLQSGDVDDAMSAARLRSYSTLLRGTEDAAAVEWGIPVLHRAPGIERLFAEFG